MKKTIVTLFALILCQVGVRMALAEARISPDITRRKRVKENRNIPQSLLLIFELFNREQRAVSD